jgi:hypothetical protein
MSGFGGAFEESDYARSNVLDRVNVLFSDALGAAAEEMWVHSPNPEGKSGVELASAMFPALRAPIKGAGYVLSALPTGLSLLYQPLEAMKNTQVGDRGAADEFIDPETLNKQYGESLGLSFDRPMRKGAVDIIVAAKEDENRRQQLLARGPSGVLFQGIKFLTQLAVAATDPVNVAASFMPIVGEARYGLWAAKFGATGARLARGGIEGGVGAAALQPLEAGYDKAFQNEYGPLDAFINVAFGSVLGGGLHAGFGAISDLLTKAGAGTREAALRSAVAQAAEGRPVDVGAVMAADPVMGGDEPNIAARTLDESRSKTEAFNRGQEPGTAVSPEASINADEALKVKQGDDIEAQLQEALATVADHEKQGILTPEQATEARSGSEDIKRAKQDGDAALAASRCLNLHP